MSSSGGGDGNQAQRTLRRPHPRAMRQMPWGPSHINGYGTGRAPTTSCTDLPASGGRKLTSPGLRPEGKRTVSCASALQDRCAACIAPGIAGSKSRAMSSAASSEPRHRYTGAQASANVAEALKSAATAQSSQPAAKTGGSAHVTSNTA